MKEEQIQKALLSARKLLYSVESIPDARTSDIIKQIEHVRHALTVMLVREQDAERRVE